MRITGLPGIHRTSDDEFFLYAGIYAILLNKVFKFLCIWFVLGCTMAFGNSVPQFIWFYKPPSNGNLTQLVSNFNNFIFTKGDENTVISLKSMGVTTPFLQYVRGDAIQKPAPAKAAPLRNQVAFNIGDF